MYKDERQKGFTLLELIVTIGVAAIIVTFGVPGFMSFIDNNRAVTDTNDLVTALNLGRSEATRRGSPVVVCSSTDGDTCNGDDDWSTGWVLRTDGAGGSLLRSWPKRSGGAGVLIADEGVEEIQFQARGSIAAGGVSFEVRLPDCSGVQVRIVEVNATGRTSVSREDC